MTNARALAAAASALALFGAAPAGAAVHVSTEPRLRPAFAPGISDYVVRCVPGRPLVLRVRAEGEKVSVAGRKPRGGEFEVSVRRGAGGAVTVRGTTKHHIRCLPKGFPDWTVERRGKPQAQWYAVAPLRERLHGYSMILDSRGVPVWWRHSSSYGPWDTKFLRGGHVAWTQNLGDKFGLKPEQHYEERRLDGRLVRRIRAVGVPTDTHELTQLPNGNYYVIAYRPRRGVDLSAYGGPTDAKVFDAEVQELTPAGKVVWRWNSKGRIAPSETGAPWWEEQNDRERRHPGAGYDLVHFNSVAHDGDGVIVSGRHVDAVYRIDKRTKRIDWKLGGTLRPERLAVQGQPAGPVFGGQHDARLHSDGTVTVYDNGSRLGRPPAAVRYRIDPLARTATLLEHLQHPAVDDSPWVGSARKLPGGNWVVGWGGTSLVTEQRPDGTPVLSLTFGESGDFHSYRAAPLPFGRISAHRMRQGMTRMTARLRRSG